MTQSSRRVALLSGAAGGSIFGIAMFLLNLSRDTSQPLWFRVLLFGGAAVVFGFGMGFAVYHGMIKPWWSQDPPPPGFGDRQVTVRERIVGDGRPFPASMRRSATRWGAASVIGGALLSVIGGVTGTLWPTSVAGLLLVALGVGNIAVACYRSVPRPPYSTWLGQQHAAEPTQSDRRSDDGSPGS